MPRAVSNSCRRCPILRTRLHFPSAAARRPPDALPGHLQRHDRLQLRRRPLARSLQRRHRAPHHDAPRPELFPKFSPDGKTIAFTAQYDGNFNVYTIPSEGGDPKQLTFLPDSIQLPERMGPNNEILTWTPDGKSIVFLSRRSTYDAWFGRPYTVPVTGGLPVQMAFTKGGLMSFSPDGDSIAYNRIFRNFRTWKRYQRRHAAANLPFYNFKTNHYEEVTDLDGNDSFPMWRGDTVYFDSDRGADRRMNIWAYDTKTKQIASSPTSPNST